MYKEYGEIKFKGMDNVRKSDVDFLKGLIAYVESQERDTTRYIYQNGEAFREYIKKDYLTQLHQISYLIRRLLIN